MSMLIIGVNPPKSCYVCGWYDKVQCPVNDGRYYYRAQRHPSCPLIELPPHGRLVDADKLVMSLADWWYSSFGEEETDEAKAIRTVMDKIEQSIGDMTVVEAEGVTE